jgi:Transposase DDE domain group 1
MRTRRIVFIALLVVCFGAGAIVQKTKLYPLQPVRAVRDAIVGNPLDRFLADTAPNPRNSIFEAFHPHADIVMIGDGITQGAEWKEIFPTSSIANRGIAGDKILPMISCAAENVVAFYNKRGTCEQWIKEGKAAIRWTRLSCRSFAANAVRLQLHALAYNLGNFLRTLATPEPIKDWSLTSLKERLIKTGAKIVSMVAMSLSRWPKSPFRELSLPTSCG